MLPTSYVIDVAELVVAPKHQGQGIGRRFLEAIIAEAQRSGLNVALTVASGELISLSPICRIPLNTFFPSYPSILSDRQSRILRETGVQSRREAPDVNRWYH